MAPILPRFFNQARTLTVSVIGLACLAGIVRAESEAELQRKVERLERQNAVLRTSYAQAQKEAAHSAEQLAELKKRLEALGSASFSDSEQRLVQAVADIEVLNNRLKKLEESSVRLSGTVIAYMKQAVTEDPQGRAMVEAKLRDLDAVLGLRVQPATENHISLADARIVSIDSESGLLVLNVGSSEGLRIGTPMRISRGEQMIGEAVISDVRQNISGALIQKLESPDELVRIGDSAAVKAIDQ